MAEPKQQRITKDAQTMAKGQREISISEFFTKNRHLLGFDSPVKAILTTIKEAVDNSLDACEEAGFAPRIFVEIRPDNPVNLGIELSSQEAAPATNGKNGKNGKGSAGGRASTKEDRFKLIIEDNGPGIVAEQIPKIFGKLLYGSKFHSLKQSRGQQGIGISAAGMYGQLTTGQPVTIYSKTGPTKAAHRFQVKLDLKKNEPTILSGEETIWEKERGTRIEIVLTGSYKRGQHSVDNYLEQTSIANPHLHLTYMNPKGESVIYPNSTEELPPEAKEIKPHPYGVELGILTRMLADTKSRNLTAFMKDEFCKVGNKTAERLKRAVAIKLVIAWRIMLMTLLGREVPELPAEVMFSDLEIKVLTAWSKKKDFPVRLV